MNKKTIYQFNDFEVEEVGNELIFREYKIDYKGEPTTNKYSLEIVVDRKDFDTLTNHLKGK